MFPLFSRKDFVVCRLALLAGLTAFAWTCAPPALAGTINWDGDNPVGNLSYNNNWYGDSNPTSFGGWVFSNDLQFNFNNGAATSIYDDYGAWQNISNITFMSTFNGVNGVTSLDGNGNGFNFNQKVENQSSTAVTITLPLSGAKNGATQIELNPVNGNLTLNGSIFNDNSKPYFVYGDNGKTLTLNTILGVGSNASAVSLTIAQNSIVQLNTAQTYTGATNIQAGRLELSSATGVSTGSVGGAITLGNTTGTAAAELRLTAATGGYFEDAAITVNSGSTGTKTISSTNASGTNTLSGNVAMNTNTTFNVATGGTLAMTGNFSGGNTLTKTGAGVLSLSGNNNFSQNGTGYGILVNQGVLSTPLISDNTNTGGIGGQYVYLQLSGGGTFRYTGTADVSTAKIIPITSSGGIDVQNATTKLTIASQMASSATLIKYGAGTLDLGTNGNNTGLILDAQAGTVNLSKGYAVASISNISSGATVKVTANAGIQTISNGANTLTINGGTFDLNGRSQALATLSGTGGLVTSGATGPVTLTVGNSTASTTFGGVIENGLGTVGLTLQYGQTQILTGANTYTGATTIDNSSSIQLGNGGTTGSISPSSTIANNGGTFTVSRSNTVTQGTDFGTLAGSSAKFKQTGSGITILNAANTYTGGTTVSSGTLQFAKTNSMPSSGTVSVSSGATLAVNAGGTGEFTNASSGNGSIGALLTNTGGQGGAVSLAVGATLGIDTTNATGGVFTYSNGITNSNYGTNTLGLTKLGTGTLALTAANTYSGPTTVSTNGGTLKVDNNGSTTTGKLGASSAITVNSGGTLLLAGTGSADRITNAAPMTLAGGTVSTQGISSSSEAMGALTLSANSVIDFGTGNMDTLNFASLSLGTFSLRINNWTGSFYSSSSTADRGDATQDHLSFAANPNTNNLTQITFYDDNNTLIGPGQVVSFASNAGYTYEIVPVAVPEPTTVVAAVNLLLLLGFRERRRLGGLARKVVAVRNRVA